MTLTPDPRPQEAPPLAVDLDGSLICSDLFFESLVALLRRNVLYCVMLPLWWSRGRATLKQEVAQRVELDIAGLPFRTAVIDYLHGQHAAGRKLVLATAANAKYARQVAAHLGVFEAVLASDGGDNMKGAAKARALAEHFPEGFDYLGDSSADLAVWARSAGALVVAPAPALLERVQRVCRRVQVLDDGAPSGWPVLVRALRRSLRRPR